MQKLRLTFRPLRILADGQLLQQRQTLELHPGWTFDPGLNVVMVKSDAHEVIIEGSLKSLVFDITIQLSKVSCKDI